MAFIERELQEEFTGGQRDGSERSASHYDPAVDVFARKRALAPARGIAHLDAWSSSPRPALPMTSCA